MKRTRLESESSSSSSPSSDEISLELEEIIESQSPVRPLKRLRRIGKPAASPGSEMEVEESQDAEEDDEDDYDEEEDSFIVDDDIVEYQTLASSLANAIGTKESRDHMSTKKLPSAFSSASTIAASDANKVVVKPHKPAVSRISRAAEWGEEMENRRRMRITGLRNLAKEDPVVQKMLERSDNLRREKFGSKKMHHPLGLTCSLFSHQMTGVAFCLLREAIPFKGVRGGVLADDMGVGKTRQMLTLVAFDAINGYTAYRRKDEVEVRYFPPTLLVVPSSLIVNWKNEIDECFEPSALQVVILNGTYTKEWATSVPLKRLTNADLVIINYEGLRAAHKVLIEELASHIISNPKRYLEIAPAKGPSMLSMDQKTLASLALTLAEKHFEIGFQTIWNDPSRWTAPLFVFGHHFRRIILDESTSFKNDLTRTFSSIVQLRAERVWALSGTPLENSLDELYSLLRILGMDRTCRSIRDKIRWHHFLSIDRELAGGSDGNQSSSSSSSPGATHVPAPVVVESIRKRFLHVQLRREFHNMNTNNKLKNYVLRAHPETEHAWDTFVEARVMAKKERELCRNPSAFVDDAIMEGAVDTRSAYYNRHLDLLTEQRLEDQGDGSLWKLITKGLGISPGFYWNTRQKDFMMGYNQVNAWLKQAFDVSIELLSDSAEAARNVLVEHKIAAPTTPIHWAAIRSAIKGVMEAAPYDKLLRGPIAVMDGFPLPQPLLFVAHMNSIEQIMYDSVCNPDLLEESSTDKGPSLKRIGKPENNAFEFNMQSRMTCADYRAPRDALQKLSDWEGVQWNTPERPETAVSYDTRTFDATLFAEEIAEAATSGVIGTGEDDGNNNNNNSISKKVLKGDEKQMEESLKKAASAYRLPPRASTKCLMLLRYVRSVPAEDKIVIFSDLVRHFKYIQLFLEQHGVRSVYVTGQLKPEVRDRLINSFKDTGEDSPRVLIASLGCLSRGHNLQVANHVIIWTPWWNGAKEEQAKRRIIRLLQMKKVYIVYFAFTATIEELVMSKAGLKEAMISAVIGEDDGIVQTSANFSRPDIKNAHFMKFDTDAAGAYVIPESGHWEKSIQELEALPVDPRFGRTFSHVHDTDIISGTGRLSQIHVAQAILSAKGRFPNNPPQTTVTDKELLELV